MRKLMVWLYALLLLLVGAGLRVWNMTAEAASYDEIAASLAAIRGVGDYLGSPQLAQCPPLYYLILHPLSWAGGFLWLMRLPSVIAGALVPVLIYVLGRRHFGNRAAGMAGFLLAVNPLHVFYSQEVKSAALFTLLLVAAFYFLIRSAEKNKFSDWALFDVFSVALAYTNRGGVFLLGVFLLIHLSKVLFFRDPEDPRRLRRSRLLGTLLYNYVIVTACCLPWFLMSAGRSGPLEPVPEPLDLLRVFARFYTFGMLEPKPIRPLVSLFLYVLLVPPLIGMLRTLSFRTLAAVVALVVGLLVLYAVSLTPVASFSSPREGVLLVPLFALALGALIGRCNAYVRTGLFVLFSMTFLYGTVRQGLPGSQQKTPWGVINNVVESKARTTDLLVYWPDSTLQVGEYYFGNRYKMVSATDLFEKWGEQPMNQSVFFIISKFPAPGLHLYTFPGALHQYAKSDILRMNGLDCVIQTRELNMLNLKLWYANPQSLNVVDEPSSDTQFLFTAADVLDSKDQARSLFRNPQFHWNEPGMCYELNGRRIIWTKGDRTDLELPVSLTPGNYILKLHCSPRFEQPEYNRDYERTVELGIRTGEERKKLSLDKETVVRVPFTTDREKRTLPVHIEVSPVQKIDRPRHMTFGIKIYSISIDQAMPEAALP
jgi:hypothetical protein